MYNRSVTKFFQTNPTLPHLWNACDAVLQFKFRIMHVAGSEKTEADFQSRRELTSKKRSNQLKLRTDILTSPVEVNLKSTDIVDEEDLFLLRDEEEEPEHEFFARKALIRRRAIEEKEQELSTKVTDVKKVRFYSAVYSFRAIEERIEQDAYPLISDVTTRHCYLPTITLTDKGSQFRSEGVNHIPKTLDIRISHATTKHTQTIGLLERMHAP